MSDTTTNLGWLDGLMGALLVVGLLSTAGGCQKKLFPEKDPRNQFEVHDQLRQDYTPMEVPNAFGEPEPALRARLAPKQ